MFEYFERGRERLADLVAPLSDDVEGTIDEAANTYRKMIPDMAYADCPDHPMAPSLIYCCINLAVYLALKDGGVDVHTFGKAMLDQLATFPATERTEGERPDFTGPGTHPGEFVVEVLEPDDSFAWGFNITSCAICHQFSKYDAMDLVPYMCASDDVESDKAGLGLRRAGTIALGAHQCDFRYQPGGEAGRVAETYPDKIRLV